MNELDISPLFGLIPALGFYLIGYILCGMLALSGKLCTISHHISLAGRRLYRETAELGECIGPRFIG